MARVEVTANNFPGSALQGSGADTLVLVGGGTFDFAYVTLTGFSAIAVETDWDDYTSVIISGEQLAGITSVSSTSAYTSVSLTGSQIDLSGKTFDSIYDINIATENATVTVTSLALALKLRAYEHQGETIVLNGPITTPTSRADLFDQGFDTIKEGASIWTNAPPTLTGLSGSFHVRASHSVSLDPERDAIIADSDGPISALDIKLSGNGRYYVMDNFELGGNFTILDNSFDQSLFYKGTLIAQIGTPILEEKAHIVFNSSATPAIINEFVQNLSYAAGDFVYERNVVITVTAYDEGQRKAESVLFVIAEKNWTPTVPVLKGSSVAERAAAGTVVGTLKAEDANGDPVHYVLTDDAGGRFSIIGDKLVVSGNAPLDFEKAAKHTVTVVASDGEKNGLPATYTISVTDILEAIKGTRGNDRLTGAGGKDLLNGGLGNDILTGGKGNDFFVFNTKPSKTNIDRITDFLPKVDKIHLENAIFKSLGKAGALKKGMFYQGSHAHDRDDRIIYDKKTGALFYDPDGTGAAKAIQFATLSNKADLKYTDILVI